MTYRKLAEGLISAENETKRNILLEENQDQANVDLAWHLKEICYESWTNEPTIAQKTATALKTLAKFNSNEEIKAILFWISGISELTKGNLEKTILKLDESAEIFKQIGNEYESANTQNAKLIPLALMGKYKEAIQCGETLLKFFEKANDEFTAGKIEVNLGNIVTRFGEHKKAKKYFLSARKRFIKIKEKPLQTVAENGLANAYVDLNDFRQAEKFYDQALKSAKEAKMFVTEAEIESSLGKLAMFRGNFSEALNYLEMSRRKYQSLKMPHQKAIADLEIAEIYQTLNLTDEAYQIYEQISESLKNLKLQGEEARTRKNFGKVSLKKREFSKAREELQKSASLYFAENNSSGVASVKLSEANLELILGNYETALEIIYEAKKNLKDSENLRWNLQADFLHGEILRSLETFEAAQKILNQTYHQAIKNEQMILAQNCLNSLGNLSLQTGQKKKAEKYFKRSIEIIENLRSPLPAEEFQMAFLANNLTPFENLAKIHLSKNKIEEAFILTEKAKSRSLNEAIRKIGDKPSKQRNQDIELNSQVITLREELNWYYSRLNRFEEFETNFENLHSQIRNCEKQISEIRRQIDSTHKSKADSLSNNLKYEVSIKELQKEIGKNQALIEYVTLDGQFSAFVITNEDIRYFPDLAFEFGIVALVEGLQFQFGALRNEENLLPKFIDDLKRKTHYYLQKFYQKLLKPLEDSINGKDLIIIPVSSLFYVPFQGLYDGEKYIIEKRKVITSPSATIWKLLKKKQPAKSLDNALLMGFADKSIPLVNQEIKTLKKIFPAAKTFSGKNATFANYTENAENFDIVHLACHGQFRPDNPLFSSLHLADGFVTVRDICSQNLNAELVTLSACETGLNKIYAGDEVLGLTRGFLKAGVQTLVLSLWTVNDKATKDLMKIFYTELKSSKSIGESLQKAQKHFIKKGKHPYFWASFGIIGK